ncbi:hypothetical protein [Nonomuraea recticatena]
MLDSALENSAVVAQRLRALVAGLHDKPAGRVSTWPCAWRSRRPTRC